MLRVPWAFLVFGSISVAGMLSVLAVSTAALRDFIPPKNVSFVMAMYAAMNGVGRILGFSYQYILPADSEISYTFLTTCGVSVLVFGALLHVLREPEATEGSVKYLRYKSGRSGESAWNDAYAGYFAPLVNKDFAIIAGARVFYYMHFAGESMLLYFYRDGLGFGEKESIGLLAAMGLVTCASYILLAPVVMWLTRTVGRFFFSMYQGIDVSGGELAKI